MFALAVVLCALAVAPAGAQVTVVRDGSENPMKEIATSTIYGGLAGLLLGGATALAVEENEDSIVKWFFVGGTFFGFGYGIYHVSRRPEPHALLRLDDGEPTIGVPIPRVSFSARDAGLSMTLLSVSF
jgi:hypothetical protein